MTGLTREERRALLALRFRIRMGLPLRAPARDLEPIPLSADERIALDALHRLGELGMWPPR